MADETKDGAPAPDPEEITRTEQAPPPDPAELRREAERYKAQLAKANADARKNRERLEELERAEEDRKAATLSESEKARRQQAEVERRAKEAEQKSVDLEMRLRREIDANAVEREAARQGFHDPDLVPRLIDDGAIDHDEDNRPTKKSVKEAIEKLAKDRPNLVAAKQSGGTPAQSYKRPTYQGNGNPPETPDQEAYRRRIETGEYGRM